MLAGASDASDKDFPSGDGSSDDEERPNDRGACTGAQSLLHVPFFFFFSCQVQAFKTLTCAALTCVGALKRSAAGRHDDEEDSDGGSDIDILDSDSDGDAPGVTGRVTGAPRTAPSAYLGMTKKRERDDATGDASTSASSNDDEDDGYRGDGRGPSGRAQQCSGTGGKSARATAGSEGVRVKGKVVPPKRGKRLVGLSMAEQEALALRMLGLRE